MGATTVFMNLLGVRQEFRTDFENILQNTSPKNLELAIVNLSDRADDEDYDPAMDAWVETHFPGNLIFMTSPFTTIEISAEQHQELADHKTRLEALTMRELSWDRTIELLLTELHVQDYNLSVSMNASSK